jgi:hypothetical protein
MEKQFTDLSNVIRPYTGMAIDRWSLRATAGNNAIITTSFGFLGSRELPFVSSTAGDGSPTAAPTDGVVNAIDHVQAIYTGVDTGAIERDLTEFDFELVNSLRGRQVIGFLGNKSMGEGTVGVTGNANSFFEDTTEADKLANDQASALALVITRGNYSMAIDLPNVKYSGGDQVAGGINQDVTNRLQFTALMNATELKTIRVALFTQP